MTRIIWIKNGDLVPRGHRLLQVLMQEERPVYGTTHSERWVLCELEILEPLVALTEETPNE